MVPETKTLIGIGKASRGAFVNVRVDFEHLGLCKPRYVGLSSN